MTGNIAIFWPMIVQAFLTLAIYPVLFLRRRAAVRSGQARMVSFRIPASEPETSATAVRNLANQYELPVLFYAVCLALYVTNGASWLAVVLAWIFVLTRIAHAVIHLGSNTLRLRIPAFFAGVIVMVILWLVLAIHVANVGRVVSGL